MHAMIRHYRMGTGDVDDLMRTVDTTIADRAQTSLGILGYQAVALADDTVMTVTLFATEEQLRNAEPMADRIRHTLSDFAVELIAAHDGKVMVARGSDALAEPVRDYEGR